MVIMYTYYIQVVLNFSFYKFIVHYIVLMLYKFYIEDYEIVNRNNFAVFKKSHFSLDLLFHQ